jgi:hypothetical protein
VRKADDFELIDIFLTDAGGSPLTVISSAQEAVVRCRYRFERPLVSPTFGIGIHTIDFNNLATENSEGEFFGTNMPPGIHELSCTFGQLPFRAGLYALRLGITAGIVGEVIFYGENLYTFQIDRAHRQGSGPVTDGHVALDARWSISVKAPTMENISASHEDVSSAPLT